ncbi:hypothetical protein [Psychrobacter pygoscelis]|uniref:hypothetical protein n=1 Tax=Psychrobacter pygoscelis TaxID=2488563 RepID=UPI0013F47668|nr:hypothetical protein [Psychrobacter pygoscelis]
MTIEFGHWQKKDTGELVRVIWQSNELVTYQTASKTLNTLRKFVFMQDFERVRGE